MYGVEDIFCRKSWIDLERHFEIAICTTISSHRDIETLGRQDKILNPLVGDLHRLNTHQMGLSVPLQDLATLIRQHSDQFLLPPSLKNRTNKKKTASKVILSQLALFMQM